ncbi:hypothetical protein GUJ93_ZPchr0006g43245 [Zizania palustris]|uniref:Uncharacterized protein n=1 Tax=Zizania palustris TaxID=103762 RepID=A0A8J5TDM0_ZIZPA|nr:hypothetical protein GUJ93_ZPchr0006g43245 [Zizania palustris]
MVFSSAHYTWCFAPPATPSRVSTYRSCHAMPHLCHTCAELDKRHQQEPTNASFEVIFSGPNQGASPLVLSTFGHSEQQISVLYFGRTTMSSQHHDSRLSSWMLLLGSWRLRPNRNPSRAACVMLCRLGLFAFPSDVVGSLLRCTTHLLLFAALQQVLRVAAACRTQALG